MAAEGRDSPYFSTLPEGCISSIVSLTSPADVCRLMSVSPDFKSVCDSNVVWASFLPLDCRQIASRSFSSLKELYFSLCNEPVLISDGKMSFSLDRHSGKKCIMPSARGLSITWGDTPMYWSWYRMPNSRFAEIAELTKVWWLEIKGTISSCMLSLGTLYAAYLVFNFTEIFHGFDFESIEVGVGFTSDEGGKCERLVYLSTGNNTPGRQSRLRSRGMMIRHAIYRREVELGEFLTTDGEDREVEISVLETKGQTWKARLVVEGIEIRPKDGKEKCLYAGRV
ncbi:hypothetical protein BT93_H1049 [Corymbia citriodora subsp. variegata]|nr:hypothetical protein BT93_H1049 [Corymbia citriodora subsp. variegata]